MIKEKINIKNLINLEKGIFKLYTKLKISEIEDNNKVYDETTSELKKYIDLEDYEFRKIFTNLDKIKICKNQINNQFEFVNNDISVNNILQNLFDTKKDIYSLDLFNYDDYTIIKLAYNRIYEKLVCMEAESPDYEEEKIENYYEGDIIEQTDLEQMTGIYVYTDQEYSFEYEEYFNYALENDHVLAFNQSFRKQLDIQAESDLYIKYIILLECLRNNSEFDYLITDRIYDLCFINPITEKNMLDNDFDADKLLTCNKKQTDANLRYMDLKNYRICEKNLIRILSEINMNNDIDLGIENNEFVFNDMYHKNNYYLIILKLILLRVCNLSLEEEQVKKYVDSILNIKNDTAKETIYHLILQCLNYKENDSKILGLK